MNREANHGLCALGLLLAAASISGMGCAEDLQSLLGGVSESPDGSTEPEGTNPTPDEEGGFLSTNVTVRFSNRTVTSAVNVQFYTAPAMIAALPDELFVEEHRLIRGIGLAGTGIIGPDMDDEISVSCTPDLTIGTAGGQFSDAETGDERGVGVARWVQNGPLALCGSIVTFVFTRENGEFTTRVSITERSFSAAKVTESSFGHDPSNTESANP